MKHHRREIHKKIRYCVRCCMPETSEGLRFDEMGICSGCQSSEQKMHINWSERERKLREILDFHRGNNGNNYDCIVPISGGKDSCFQLHVLKKVYQMRPLAVTFSHNWFTDVGEFNLKNILEKLSVDHMMFTPNREVVNKIAKKSLTAIGDSCWHCHAGVGAYPLKMAIMMKIPLLVWGESIAEAGNKAMYSDDSWDTIKFDHNYYLKVSSKVEAKELVDENLSSRDLYPFELPSEEEFTQSGIEGIHLGDYIFWDGERQVEFLKREYGWKEGNVDGTYKGYKSCECIMPGVHDYAKFVKRGFGRTTDHVSQDIRAGLLTREEGFQLINEFETKRPKSLDNYLEITGYTDKEFHEILKEKRTGKAKEIED